MTRPSSISRQRHLGKLSRNSVTKGMSPEQWPLFEALECCSNVCFVARIHKCPKIEAKVL